MSDVSPEVAVALEEIEQSDDARSREIEMRFVKQTDNRATEPETFGDLDGIAETEK